MVDQDLEPGLRSIAVPVLRAGRVVAAVNIGTQAVRVPLSELRARYLPALRKVARDLSAMMAH